MKRAFLLLLAGLLIVGAATGDTIRLKNGAEFEGQIVSENDKVVVFKIRGLGAQSFKRGDIASLERKESIFDEYEAKLGAVPAGDASAFSELALWCMENGLRQEAKKAHRKAIAADPDHAESRRALGYSRVAGKWLTRRQVKKYREKRRKEVEQVVGSLSLASTVKDKEAQVSMRPPRGWERRSQGAGMLVEFAGPELHGVGLAVGYEVVSVSELDMFKKTVLERIAAKHGEVSPVRDDASASLGGRMARESTCRYGPKDALAERRDLYTPWGDSTLHVFVVYPAEDGDALRGLFTEVCNSFSEPAVELGNRPFAYKLPDTDWAEGFGLPEGMEDTEIPLGELPPGVALIHHQVHPVIVFMLHEKMPSAGDAPLEQIRDLLFRSLIDSAAANYQLLANAEKRRKISGRPALVSPWRGRDSSGAYAEGYIVNFQRRRDLYVIFCISMDGLMGSNYLEKDFSKLLDSFVIRGAN